MASQAVPNLFRGVITNSKIRNAVGQRGNHDIEDLLICGEPFDILGIGNGLGWNSFSCSGLGGEGGRRDGAVNIAPKACTIEPLENERKGEKRKAGRRHGKRNEEEGKGKDLDLG
uniref:uncharacterized protein LOC105350497 n=1 Tax=Fragaria vesca subsp. vesca TaxID=101020 RepID=UPI0005CA1766|nr:PREDICTED: uncharacterized protein LOC105350497 [Fragaria vesca subsp. vesca]